MEMPKKSDALELQEADATLNNSSAADELEITENVDSVDENAEEPQGQIATIDLSKDEIVAEMEKLLQEKPDQVKDAVTRLKNAFAAIRKKEIEVEKQAFLDKGNEEAAFAVMDDAAEIKMKELLAKYKELRAEQLAAIEAEKQANLEKKNAILDEMRTIIADVDNVNRQYNKFQQLQQDFKAVGDTPAETVTSLWKTYQQLTENFYDLLKINKDLRDYDFKKNLEAKEELIKQAAELDTLGDVVDAFRKLQNLHNEWREIGPIAPEIREEVWNRFKEISTSINKKYQAFFENRKEKEKENETAKTALCERIEAIDTNTLATYAAWDEATEQIKQLQEEWRKIGFAARAVNAALFARFRKTCDEFFARKAEFFKSMKEAAARNLEKKIALCERAEALMNSTDWKKTTQEINELHKEWKTVGPVLKKHSDAVWRRFLDACNHFFAEKEKNTSSTRKTEHANLETKREIVAQLKALAEGEVTPEGKAKVKELIKQWREVGHVPFKEKDNAYNEFQAVVKVVNDKFDLRETHSRMANYEKSIDKISSDSDKLYRERERLMRAYEAKHEELKTYETNMLFFEAKSKTGNSLLKDMERKIVKIKEELVELENKVKMIDAKMD